MPYKDKEKRNKWNRIRWAENKKVSDELKSKPCTDCKNTFPPYCMEWDHVPGRGEKKVNVGCLLGSRKITAASIVAELAKCDLVCSNCHKVRTFTRK